MRIRFELDGKVMKRNVSGNLDNIERDWRRQVGVTIVRYADRLEITTPDGHFLAFDRLDLEHGRCSCECGGCPQHPDAHSH